MRVDKIRAEFELAWTSVHKANKMARFVWDGLKRCQPRYGFHPHEKPAKLYAWLLSNYARPGWTILDTFMGSGTIAVACHDLGFDLTACEINAEYYAQAVNIIGEHIKQYPLFNAREVQAANYPLFQDGQ